MDIGLLLLQRSVILSSDVWPICLYHPAISVPLGTELIVAGKRMSPMLILVHLCTRLGDTNSHQVGSHQFSPGWVTPILTRLSHQFSPGWGRTETEVNPSTLRFTNVTQVEASPCETEWSEELQERNPGFIGIKLLESQMCAGDVNSFSDACSGDSGGPLMVNLDNRWYLEWLLN